MSLTQKPGCTVVKEKSKAARIGPVSVSLLIHLAFMMVIGGVVIIEQVIPKSNFKPAVLGESLDQVEEKVAEPDETLPDPGAPSNPEMSENETAAPENSLDLMAVQSPVSSPTWMVATSPSIGTVGQTSGGGGGTAGSGSGKGGPRMKNPFGELTRSDGTLQGTFYDLKQTPDRKPSGMDAVKYNDVIREFEKKNWNIEVFKNFYKAPQPIYASQFFIPLQGAAEAPKAFHVEKEVQPSQWVIVYEGKFSVQKAGRYRFAGYADDLLLVRINGETVLDGSIALFLGAEDFTVTKMKQTIEKGQKVGNGGMIYGKWLDFDSGVPQKIEVLLGERPGGKFCAFLMIESKSDTYQKAADGRPILPLFQMAETDLKFESEIRSGLAPSFSDEKLIMGSEK